jgi:hypothetical protein
MSKKAYILTGGKHAHIERSDDGRKELKTYGRGEKIVLTDTQAFALKDKIRPFIEGGSKLKLPEGWQDLSAAKKKTLAGKIKGGKVSTVKEADEILVAYENDE